jgi:GMP synthase-like glutamine amidotransferase
VKSLTVLQHNSAEYLGLIEDHFEARRIRFRYVRPFTGSVGVPGPDQIGDGLVLLGGGPWGAGGGRDLPTLAKERALTYGCMMANRLVIGFGLGAQILCLAGEGGVTPAPLQFRTGHGRRVAADALNGYLPERFPYAIYMRDWPAPPAYAKILAVDEEDRPLVFQLGETAFGFAFHPGFKLAMAEDLIMEFEEGPADPGPALAQMQTLKHEIEDALAPIMTGLVQVTGLMRDPD